MRIRILAAMLASVLFAAAACHRAEKADPIAALDNAYKAGLLTKDEYDAKRLALVTAAPAEHVPPAPASALAVSPKPSTKSQVPASVATQTSTPAGASLRKENQPAAQRVPVKHPSHEALPSLSHAGTPPQSRASSASPSAAEVEPAPLLGCEDAEVKSGGQKGKQERFFAASPEAVRRAAISALGGLDFNIHKDSNGEIEASRGRHLGVIVGAGGERVNLTFQKFQNGGRIGTRVVGETKKSFVGRMAQRNWTDAVMAQIACKLLQSRR